MSPSSAPPKPPRNDLQLIGRAAAVLRALEAVPDGLALTELSVAAGLPKSTVHRLVGALRQEDFVTLLPGGKWHLGRGLARLGAAARGSLREDMRHHLLRLAKEVNETVDLSILDGEGVRFIDQVLSTRRLVAVSAVGVRFPLHCTANGKALLAAMPAEQAEAILPSRLQSLTPHTITSRKALLAELETVRAEGVAFDREEHTEGISAVGTVVRDAYGVAAAVSIAVPTQRFTGEEDKLETALRQTCAAASEDLGAAPDPEPVAAGK